MICNHLHFFCENKFIFDKTRLMGIAPIFSRTFFYRKYLVFLLFYKGNGCLSYHPKNDVKSYTQSVFFQEKLRIL